ncbi:MAG TPA: hypothetical protein VEJ47_18670 [Candidatus Eremiobacteraceae bacterium]|nr:hypothetical protein [Candidatus Eremiobacteraceae bacterium]
MDAPKFDIFSGRDYRDAVWIEAVDGLGAANDRMKQLAAQRPGAYFVFSTAQGMAVARLDTNEPDGSATNEAVG